MLEGRQKTWVLGKVCGFPWGAASWKPPQPSFSPRRKSAEVTRSRWCCCLQGPSLLFICIMSLALIDIRSAAPSPASYILVTGRKKQRSKKKNSTFVRKPKPSQKSLADCCFTSWLELCDKITLCQKEVSEVQFLSCAYCHFRQRVIRKLWGERTCWVDTPSLPVVGLQSLCVLNHCVVLLLVCLWLTQHFLLKWV